MAEWETFNGEDKRLVERNGSVIVAKQEDSSPSTIDESNNLVIKSDRDKLVEGTRHPALRLLGRSLSNDQSRGNSQHRNRRSLDPDERRYDSSNVVLVDKCDFDSSRNDESGLRIRQEARQELNQSRLSNHFGSQNPTFIGETVGAAVDIGNVRVVESPRLRSRQTTASKEKLTFNGKSSSEDNKSVHHVQFDREQSEEPATQSGGRPHPSPSISTSTSSSSEDNSILDQFSEARPPDGGWGWVVVAAAFMVNLIADGITFSFGVIYVEFLNYFGEGKSKTAWIGSLFMAMPMLSGPIASFLTDRYGCRKVSIAGSILATTGFVISSFSNSMGLLIFTFGVVSGFGLSLCFVAAVVIVAYYFDKKRSFATGLSVCGSGIGTFIFAPLTQYLLAEYGWRGTTLILAGFFFNLAVCGCLMRDLEWTTIRAKAKTEERKKNRQNKRKMLSSSADTFSASSSVNTNHQPQQQGATTSHEQKRTGFASANAVLIENLRFPPRQDEDGDKLFSSLVSLPTFVKNGERVPLEVLELLSTHKNVYNVLLQNYPNLMISSRSFSESGASHDQLSLPSARFVPTASSPVANLKGNNNTAIVNDQKSCIVDSTGADAANVGTSGAEQEGNYHLSWFNKRDNNDEQFHRPSVTDQQRKLPTAYLKDIRVHRQSLTYRGAMLNITRYRLRASSCPDIYRNSMTTIAKTKMVWYAGLWDFWDLLVDMLDFSHFTDSRFLLFAISNFLLHLWYDVPYVYLTDNAIEVGFSDTDASMLISIIGITNMSGEIILGWAGDKTWVNPLLVYACSTALSGAVVALIPLAVKNYMGLCAISGAFGFFISANYSLTSIILVELITLERFTNAYGLLLLVQGLSNLMGPPLAGWLYDITGTYDLSFYLAGLFIAASGAILLIVPLIGFLRNFLNFFRAAPEKEAPKDISGINSV